jgi:peptidoglycan/LPS O-acetylase OafA/YrhL
MQHLKRQEQALPEIYTVEVLRGLAALSVAWFHLTNKYQWDPVRYSGAYGWLGVEVFFVISGFIIPYSLQSSGYSLHQFPQFILRRFVRLEPPYLVSIVLVIVLWELSARMPGFAGGRPSYSIPQIASHLFYMVPVTTYTWLNVVYWTLAYEFGFYILTGLLWPILTRIPAVVTPIIFLIVFGSIFLVTGHAPGIIFLFLIGIAGARYYLGIDGPWIAGTIIVVVSGLLGVFVSILVALASLMTILLILFIKIPQLKFLSFLGAISYSLYLIHVPVGGRMINLGQRFADGAPFELGLSVLALTATIGVAAIFWRYIELPAKRAAKKFRTATGSQIGSKNGRVSTFAA